MMINVSETAFRVVDLNAQIAFDALGLRLRPVGPLAGEPGTFTRGTFGASPPPALCPSQARLAGR